MNKSKILVIIGGVAAIGFVIAWIFLIKSYLDTPDSLQANIQQPPEEELQLPTNIPSQQPQEKQNDLDEYQSDSLNSYSGIVRIGVPHFIPKETIQSLTQHINEKTGNSIEAEITRFASLEEYRLLIKSGQDNFDLLLAPTTRDSSLEKRAEKLPFKKELASIFHTSFERYFDDDVWYVPYGIDPILLSTRNEDSLPTATRNKLFSKLALQAYEDIIPISFGFNEVDRTILSKNRHIIIQYFDLLQTFTKYALGEFGSSTFSKILSNGFWNTKEYIGLAIRKKGINPNCKTSMNGCLMASSSLQVGIDSLSNLSLYESLYSNDNIADTYTYWLLPEENRSPAVGRGFIIPENAEGKRQALGWILGYVGYSTTDNNWTKKSIISAFLEDQGVQLTQKKFEKIGPIFQSTSFDLIPGKISDREIRMQNEDLFFEILDGKRTIQSLKDIIEN